MQGALVVGDARKRVAVMSYKRKLPIPTDAEYIGCIIGMVLTMLVLALAAGYILFLMEAAR